MPACRIKGIFQGPKMADVEKMIKPLRSRGKTFDIRRFFAKLIDIYIALSFSLVLHEGKYHLYKRYEFLKAFDLNNDQVIKITYLSTTLLRFKRTAFIRAKGRQRKISSLWSHDNYSYSLCTLGPFG